MAEVIYSDGATEDLARLKEFAEGSGRNVAVLIGEAVGLLARHPLLGRAVEHGLRELIISRGTTGYIALYWFEEANDTVLVLALRHQREVPPS